MLFANRREAGRRLAAALRHWASENPVVVGLPRGGVPVAFEVARELAAPLDVIVVRKLGAPFQPELALGAVGEDGAVVINRDVLLRAGLRDDELAELERTERAEVERRARLFREARERKREAHASASTEGAHGTGKVHGAHGPAASRRSFRRKSGG